MAGTHLNLCSLKSHLNKHDEALNHAHKAITIIQKNYSGQNDFTGTLVAAYHNAGLEYQFLNRKIEASNFLRQAYELALRKLGKDHNLTRSLENYAENQRKNQGEPVRDNKERNRSDVRARDLKVRAREGSVVKIEMDVAGFEKIDRDFRGGVDSLHRGIAKKHWTGAVEPLGFAESMSKPLNVSPYKRKEVRKGITQSTYIFSEKMKGKESKNIYGTDISLDLMKKSSKILQTHTSDKSKFENANLYRKEEHKASFKVRTKVDPLSSKSLSISPSKSSSKRTVEENSEKQQSDRTFTPERTTDKINLISAKIDLLQEKLDNFEQTYKNINNFKQEDNDSNFSTVSLVNNRRFQAAILIQKHFKRYIIRKKFKIMKAAAKKVQRFVRGIPTRRKIRRNLYKLKDFSQQCSIEPYPELIQHSIVERGNQTNDNVKEFIGEIRHGSRIFCKPVHKTIIIHTIIFIQSHIRGFLAKKYFKKRLQALVKIQKAVRQFGNKSIFLKVVSAIVFIQAVYRGYRTRKFFKDTPRKMTATIY